VIDLVAHRFVSARATGALRAYDVTSNGIVMGTVQVAAFEVNVVDWVCADGGNPNPTTTDAMSSEKATALELAGVSLMTARESGVSPS
jgi:hypothetical protein